MKTILKNVACRVWLGVTAVVLVIAIIVNCFASTTFYDLIGTFLGRETMRLVGEERSQFEKEFTTKEAALENGYEVSRQICEEGFTLLKNSNSALPLQEGETRVSVFGKNSVNMAMGGSGSGGIRDAKVKTIFDSLTASGFTYNNRLVDFYNDNSKSGPGRDSNPSDLDSGKSVKLSEGETPIESYSDDIWNSCNEYKDVAIIVITRIGGEGFDMPRNEDGTHILQLSKNERALVDKVVSLNFKKVIAVLNMATAFELKPLEDNDGIDAILWTGFAGANGMTAFGEIIKGVTLEGEKISPSGRTVDTYAADFTKDPTWENFGAELGGDAYTLSSGRLGQVDQQVYFVDYEEGIYVGYRYWETAYAEALNGNYEGFDYDEAVVYPFGYGLSYTNFSWELLNADELNGKELTKNTSLTFKVKVTNAEDGYPSRDVVQLYVSPQYNAGEIEKSAKVLVGFAKTGVIQPGQSETVKITVDSPYEFASYDYKDANKNRNKGYEVDSGDYAFYISKNAHEEVIAVNTYVSEDICYGEDPVTNAEVVNRYTNCDDEAFDSDRELGSVLSRKNFTGTWPQRRAAQEKNRDDEKDWLDVFTKAQANPNRTEENDEMPVYGKNNSVKFEELIGADYDDEIWDAFMDQLKPAEMTKLVNAGGFHTVAIARLGVPQTTAADGPVGFCNFLDDPTVYDTCVYPCEVVISSTWNVDRVYDMGRAVGSEGLVGNLRDDGAPYSGWYAPGLNIHRSPFGGRNFEYYSEDAFLSGKMTAAVIKGAASKGVYVNMKHFALNEQETHRSSNGLLTWVTEQSMREIYLKGFEIAVKDSMKDGVKSLGVMSSFNRIGERWTGGDYRLLTNILREEWGFKGLVISDFNTCTHMVEKDMFYAGGDLNLQIAGMMEWKPDYKNSSDMTVLRQAAKNVLYVVVNSNAMRGDFVMIIPLWQTIMFVVDGILFAGLCGWGAAVIIRAFRLKRRASEEGENTVQDTKILADIENTQD